MRAARLLEGRVNLSVEEAPDPELLPGCAIVRIETVFITPYMASLVDGSGGFETPPRPFTPGMDAIGTIERVADDVRDVGVGDRVYCDSYIEAPRADGDGDYVFAGCFEISANSGPLLAQWPNGALATHLVLPAECLTPVELALARTSAETLCRLGWIGTAYAAFEKTHFQPGQSAAVLGATGLLGVSAVLVALAMGAYRVAVGRSAERLAAFDGLDPRIETATAPPGPDDPVDLVVNAMDGGDPDLLEGSLLGLKRFGSLVVPATMETPPRVSGLVTRDITVRGSLWFSRATPARLVRLIASGQLSVDGLRSHTYSLDEVGAAIDHSAKAVPPFEQVIVCP
jgi:D-arabinose 1-dehydrogenase-like Zn-dependent alcohol dehydrogenase